MKDLLKMIARDVILPWALTAIAGFTAKKLAAKPDEAAARPAPHSVA